MYAVPGSLSMQSIHMLILYALLVDVELGIIHAVLAHSWLNIATTGRYIIHSCEVDKHTKGTTHQEHLQNQLQCMGDHGQVGWKVPPFAD